MRFTFANTPPKENSNGDKNFPPAQAYLYAEPLLRYFKYALFAALLILFFFLSDLNCSGGRALLPGPLSSSHANFGNDCAKCHITFGQVEDAKCSVCHEKSSNQFSVTSNQQPINSIKDQGSSLQHPIYSFSAHYLYRSDSLARSRSVRVRNEELPCRTCHLEHRGRDTKLAAVTNAKCAGCHFESFTDDHPNFQFARTQAPDDSSLKFTHIKHTSAGTWRAISLRDTGNTPLSPEKTCSYCHEPEPDGKLFKPISFDRHCSACHINNALTPPLPMAAKNNGEGVHTLEEVLERNEVATQWARAANPNDFRLVGETRLLKRVAHRDPWVLWHLSGRDTARRVPARHEQTIFDLQLTTAILRMTQDKGLHAQLARVDTVLRVLLKNSSQQPATSIINPVLQPPANPWADKIAKPCVECHYLSGPGVLAVNGEQEVLRRANFDHRAHIVQAQCLDCHFKIDIEKVAADTLLSVRRDRASVQNLPEIAKCRQCHAEEKATVDCARCHEFHP